jgi:hypothetical protein
LPIFIYLFPNMFLQRITLWNKKNRFPHIPSSRLCAHNASNSKKDAIIVENYFYPRYFYIPKLLNFSSYITRRLLKSTAFSSNICNNFKGWIFRHHLSWIINSLMDKE